MNLEVDRPWQIRRHLNGHLVAVQRAVARGWRPQDARSVFVGAAIVGPFRQSITHVLRVCYVRGSGGQIEAIEDPDVHLPRPLTPEQAWDRRVLDMVPEICASQRTQTAVERAAPRRP